MKKILYFVVISLITLTTSLDAYSSLINLASTAYTLKVNEDKYIAPSGYVMDHATWSCTAPEIMFVKKDNAGAIIRITESFSGSRTISLVFTEGYIDWSGRTKYNTYTKEFLISCYGGGNTGSSTTLKFPPSKLYVQVGKTIEFDMSYKFWLGEDYYFNEKGIGRYGMDCSKDDIGYITGLEPSESTLRFYSVSISGIEKLLYTCDVIVTEPEYPEMQRESIAEQEAYDNLDYVHSLGVSLLSNVEDIKNPDFQIIKESQGIIIQGAINENVNIYSSLGYKISQIKNYTGELIPLTSGIYIIKIDNFSQKVVLK